MQHHTWVDGTFTFLCKLRGALPSQHTSIAPQHNGHASYHLPRLHEFTATCVGDVGKNRSSIRQVPEAALHGGGLLLNEIPFNKLRRADVDV